MSTLSNTDALITLRSTITSLKALLQRFESTIRNASPSPVALPLQPLNPLALLSDAAKILKAQTTKLSLLALNKPFTPSAITTILKSLAQECFPALMTAAELCPIAKYTEFLHRTIRSSVGSIILEFMKFMDDIPVDERGVDKTRGRNTLASTGLIWQGCDFLVQIAELGIIAVASTKVEEYHELLKDAIAELNSWKNGEVDTEDLELLQISKHQEQATVEISPNASVLEFGSTPLMNDEMKPLVTRVLKALSLVQMLYPPLIKRRLRRFPSIDANLKDEDFPEEQKVRSFDALIRFCEIFSNEADELAGSLYLLDKKEVENRLDHLKSHASDCVGRLNKNWDGGQDEFTMWIGKWLVKVEET